MELSLFRQKKIVVIIIDFEKEITKLSACIVNINDFESITLNHFENIEEIFKRFGKKLPYALHFIGTGILNRLVNDLSTYKEQLIVNANTEEFYFTSYSDGKQRAVSFVRTELVLPYIQQFEINKIFLFSLSSGYTSLFIYLKHRDFIQLKSIYELEYKNNQITCFQRSILANENQKNTLLNKIAESLARSVLCKDNSYEQALDKAAFEKNAVNYSYYKRFSIFGVGFVVCIFMLIMMNFFYQKSLNNRMVSIEEELLLHNENMKLLENIQNERVRKMVLIQSSGVKSKHFISFYLDKIATSVPLDISLSDLTIFPLNENLKEDRKVEVQHSKIELSGIVKGSTIFENWLEKLNRFEWVQSVEVTNFSKTEESNSVFTLTIWIKQ